jgi:hypothetical protein
MRKSNRTTSSGRHYRRVTIVARVAGVLFLLAGGYGVATIGKLEPAERWTEVVFNGLLIVIGIGLLVAKRVDENNSISGWLSRRR